MKPQGYRQYRNLGDVNQFAVLRLIHHAIFNRIHAFALPDGRLVHTKKFKGGTLYAVDLDDRRYVEQNQNTRSAYADRARQGAKILWVIKRSNDQYLGYIEDGVVYMK